MKMLQDYPQKIGKSMRTLKITKTPERYALRSRPY